MQSQFSKASATRTYCHQKGETVFTSKVKVDDEYHLSSLSYGDKLTENVRSARALF